MIKQFPEEEVNCYFLSFHDHVVYIGSDGFVIQWNLVNDAVETLDGDPRSEL